KKSLPILVASLIYSFQEWIRFECENKGTFRSDFYFMMLMNRRTVKKTIKGSQQEKIWKRPGRVDCVEEPLDISALREKKPHFLSNFSHLSKKL
ncbi:hypothetical protein NECAME_13591, partial [Necator americanus]